jgi:8-oxo-dGTP diphosphatase
MSTLFRRFTTVLLLSSVALSATAMRSGRVTALSRGMFRLSAPSPRTAVRAAAPGGESAASAAASEAARLFAKFEADRQASFERARAEQLLADEDPAYPPSARALARAAEQAAEVSGAPAAQAPRIRVGVAALVRSDARPGCLLLHRRRGTSGSERLGMGAYGLPGGHLEYGEEWFDCVRRELMEEAGVEPRDLSLVTVTNAVSARIGAPPGEDYHYVCVFVACAIDAEPVRLEPDRAADEWEWHHWDDLPSPLDARLGQLARLGRTSGLDPFGGGAR